MNIISKQISFWPWFCKVLAAFFKARPLTTATVVLITTSGQVTKFLSMVLPLKVILLAGSDGVPRYFEFFISPNDKDLWIIAFVVATVALFILNYMLDNLSRRLSQSASGEILETANEITLLADQERKATSYYAKFCEVVSSFVFVALSMLIIWVVNIPLLVYWVLAIVVAVSVTSLFLLGREDVNPGWLKAYVTEKTSSYLSNLKVVIFLFGFFVILYPFVFDEGYNVLFAIISLVLFRQALGMLSSFVGDAVGLAKVQYRINALVFRDHHLEHKEHSQSVALRELFSRENRLTLASQQLSSNDHKVLLSEWLDSNIPGAKSFRITAESKRGEREFYQLQVFPPSRLPNLNNEMFLFEHISRGRLNAPALVSRFNVGPFECQIYEYGVGEAVPGSEWGGCERHLLTDFFACRPPDTLVESYAASHPMLHDRFKVEHVSRVEVGIDCHEEESALGDFLQAMPALVKYLKKIPSYVYNPDVNPRNVVKKKNSDDYFVMTWSRWQLLPLGAAVPARYDGDLDEMLSVVKSRRQDVDCAFSAQDMRLVNACYELDRAIRGERYKAALTEMKSVLALRDLFQTQETSLLGHNVESS